jgi:hypothetical protein
MIPACDYEFRARQLGSQQLERFDHQFEALVRSPLPEGKNAVLRIAPPRKIWKLGTACQYAMRAQVDIVTSVLVIQNLAISRHQH